MAKRTNFEAGGDEFDYVAKCMKCKHSYTRQKESDTLFCSLKKNADMRSVKKMNLTDDEIKLPYKISRLEAKAIKVALYHQWLKTTDDNGDAISCSQEMADATYKMLSLFDKLIRESDKDEQSKEQNK